MDESISEIYIRIKMDVKQIIDHCMFGKQTLKCVKIRPITSTFPIKSRGLGTLNGLTIYRSSCRHYVLLMQISVKFLFVGSSIKHVKLMNLLSRRSLCPDAKVQLATLWQGLLVRTDDIEVSSHHITRLTTWPVQLWPPGLVTFLSAWGLKT